MKALTRRHVEISKMYLSLAEPEHQQAAREILECIAEEYIKLQGVISMLSPKAMEILYAHIDDFKHKESEE